MLKKMRKQAVFRDFWPLNKLEPRFRGPTAVLGLFLAKNGHFLAFLAPNKSALGRNPGAERGGNYFAGSAAAGLGAAGLT